MRPERRGAWPTPSRSPRNARRRAGGDGAGCHGGTRDDARRPPRPPARARCSSSYAADYPQGPARPAADHVPGLRLAARRPAHAAHRDDPLGLGLLRLRPDLHLALLRRAAHRRLRAVQLRDAGHRQAVRGHPRRGATSSPSPTLYDAVVIINLCVPDRLRRAAATCCRRRSTACASSASTCRASACRPMPRPRTCWPAPCCATPAREAEQGPVQRPRGGRSERADGHADRRDVPGRSRRHRRAARADGPGRRRRVVPTREWRELYAALDCVGGRRHPSVLHRLASASSRRPAGRSSAPAPVGRRRHRGLARGDRQGLPASRRARSTPPRPRPCRRSGRARRQPDQGAHHACPATRARSCWSPGC